MTVEFLFITFSLILAGMIAVPLASRFGSVLGYWNRNQLKIGLWPTN